MLHIYVFIFQIRLTNGQALTQSFSVKEPLAAVRLYVEMNRTDPPGPFTLMTSFPRKVFAGEDFDKPLTELGEFAMSSFVVVFFGGEALLKYNFIQ